LVGIGLNEVCDRKELSTYCSVLITELIDVQEVMRRYYKKVPYVMVAVLSESKIGIPRR